MLSYFPNTRFYHKCGVISDQAMEVSSLDDQANEGPCYLRLLAIKAGYETKPLNGETMGGQMVNAIADWLTEK